jgi:hypothetical protein
MLTLEQQEAMRQETLNEKGTEVSVLRSAKGKEKRLRPRCIYLLTPRKGDLYT